MSVIEEGRSATSAKSLGPWLVRTAPRSARGCVTVAILPDAKVKALNKRFRNVNKATDVLSFPAETRQWSERKRRKALSPQPLALLPPLGDIVIARGLARKQARDLGHSVQTELRVLALHGLLHLLGYDHEVDDGRMARVEARLRRRARLPLGLIARSS